MVDPLGAPSHARGTLIAAVLGSGLVFLDSTVVNVALPAIAADIPSRWFGVLEGQTYIYSGYLLSLAALLILGGALADRHGRRLVFSWGLVGFAVSSVLCGLAPDVESLVLARVLQGAAGALLVPGSLAIVTEAFDGEARGRAFGIWAAASAATTVIGPLVGGALVDLVSWRAVFLINVPVAGVTLMVTWRWVTETRDTSASGRSDWTSALLVVFAVGGLTLGSIRGQETRWQEPVAFVAVAAGLVALALLPVALRRAPRPLVPPQLFRSRTFTVINLSTLVIYGGLYVLTYVATLYVQGTLGYTATAAGLVAVPAMLILGVLSPRMGRLAARHGPRWFMTGGPGLMALAALWLVRLPERSAPWRLDLTEPATLLEPGGYLVDLLPAMVLFGLGLAVLVAPLTTALMDSVPRPNAAVASAVNNAISRVGPQLAGALAFVAVTATFHAALGEAGYVATDPAVMASVSPLNAPAVGTESALVTAARHASTAGLHIAVAVCVGLFAVGAVVNGIGLRPGHGGTHLPYPGPGPLSTLPASPAPAGRPPSGG
jgi:EmrB/QacA subfamily drug resistance transporter